jgi:hypothetical protein
LSLIKSKSISVLDFWCGTAPNTYLLQSLSNVESVSAVDKMISGNLCKKLPNKKTKFSTEIPDDRFDFMMAIDLLEHIENDQEVFESLIMKQMKENGVLLLTVSAYKFLWLLHYVSLEHKRRYS